jgi:hypothetical protein
MRTTLILSLILAAAASPSAVSAQRPTQLASAVGNTAAAQATTDAKPAAAAPAERKICKRLPSSYSKRSDRVCLTEREWTQVEQDSQN